MTRILPIDADPFLVLPAMIRARPRHQRFSARIAPASKPFITSASKWD
jgi:hypothetical protein